MKLPHRCPQVAIRSPKEALDVSMLQTRVSQLRFNRIAGYVGVKKMATTRVFYLVCKAYNSIEIFPKKNYGSYKHT